MEDPSRLYHPGNRALQDAFDGRRVADALEKHRRHEAFWDDDIALIHAAPFFFIASGAEGRMDVSFKGGAPGFVRVTGPATLEWEELDGNSMYLTLGNLAVNPSCALLFMRFDGASLRLRVRGQAQVTGKQVRVTATDIFPNCPRYIPDLGTGTPSAYLDPGVAPAWKSRDYVRDILPADDPHKPA
ncbi:pyridoxamine 5'-phosphate oxidase family protein [Rhodovarius crocodyli]|uniref:Pyridoxamine 5'-phosphate oxidase family protein n=1 Tax=Rhodovarius crocodyli TaxID=1979269 RepID=A0A437MMC4_9PROT|nr:pyridoxamine 5'-phosphate oxidase family protein [Rhodovarius crocodyli]RVT98807.1 pyridoxamine 5'-phosphate oxidase family protein [Rhodovarius crocodyli]